MFKTRVKLHNFITASIKYKTKNNPIVYFRKVKNFEFEIFKKTT